MKVKKMIEILLDECQGDTTMEMMLDGPRPIPLEEIFKIEAGKGWLLFIQRKLSTHHEK